MLSAACHLVLLVSLRQPVKLQAVDVLLNFTPMIVLLFDWMFNRIYLSLAVASIYPLFGYAAFFTYNEMIRTPVTASEISEFNIFIVHPVGIGLVMPFLVAISLYIGTRVKFFILDEGDIKWLEEICQDNTLKGKAKSPSRSQKANQEIDIDEFLGGHISEGSLSEN